MLKLRWVTLKIPALALGLCLVVLLLAGCQMRHKPRLRLGSYATSTLGAQFHDADKLGRHSYYIGPDVLFEQNGIVYTCRGGHIDIAHLRIAADHVRFLAHKTYQTIMAGQDQFTYSLDVEPTMYYIDLEYPNNWHEMSEAQRKESAKQTSLVVAKYLTYLATTWHEVLTWYGYKSMAFVPEFPSAFSWEDIYSNVVGIHVGAWALEYDDYDQAVTTLLAQELQMLEPIPGSKARRLTERMRGKWWSGHLLVNMKKRNIDIGWFDHQVAPSLMPGLCDDPEPVLYEVPRLEDTQRYGFNVSIEIEPREWERHRILRIVYPDGGGTRIKPDEHLPYIMADIVYHGKTIHNYQMDGAEEFKPYVRELLKKSVLGGDN